MPKNPKRDPLSSINVFLQTENFKKFKGVRFDKLQNVSEKCRIMPKTTAKGAPFGLHYTFEALKICDLVRLSNPRSLASQTPKFVGQEVEQMNKKRTNRVELTKQN